MAPKCLKAIPCYGLAISSFCYIAISAVVEFLYPTCAFHEDSICLDRGVDNSTATMVTGFLVAFVSFVLGVHLFYEKLCFVYVEDTGEDDQDDSDDENNKHSSNQEPENSIFNSGIMGLLMSGIALFFYYLARALQPDQSLGSSIYWNCTAVAFGLWLLADFYFARFSIQALKNRKRIGCFFSCCCFSLMGLAKLLLVSSLVVILSGSFSCARQQQQNSTISTEYNIFGPTYEIADDPVRLLLNTTKEYFSSRIEDPVPDFENGHVCQDLSMYGEYIFQIANALFWIATAGKLRRAAKYHEYESRVFGMSSQFANSVIRVTASTFLLYPVWLWIVRAFLKDEDKISRMGLSLLTYEGIIFNFGLLILAICAHNCASQLTYQKNVFVGKDGVAHPRRSEEGGAINGIKPFFAREVWHDLTFGAFEKKELRTASSEKGSNKEVEEVSRNASPMSSENEDDDSSLGYGSSSSSDDDDEEEDEEDVNSIGEEIASDFDLKKEDGELENVDEGGQTSGGRYRFENDQHRYRNEMDQRRYESRFNPRYYEYSERMV